MCYSKIYWNLGYGLGTWFRKVLFGVLLVEVNQSQNVLKECQSYFIIKLCFRFSIL